MEIPAPPIASRLGGVDRRVSRAEPCPELNLREFGGTGGGVVNTRAREKRATVAGPQQQAARKAIIRNSD
jgi:hypothetical protein